MISKFTPEVRGALLERVASGVSLRDAARAVGVREKTVRSWITRGRRDGTGSYAEFVTAIEAARARALARPQPMGRGELAAVVSRMARGGSVQAAKLRWEMLRAEQTDAVNGDPMAELDQIAGLRLDGVDAFSPDDTAGTS